MTNAWRILLIDDNEDDYYLTRLMLSESKENQYVLEWAPGYEQALASIECDSLDAILVDYDLGDHNGIELVQEMIARNCRSPIIFLTGHGSYEIDLEAMRIGVVDYLNKNEVSAPLLERTIRYAIERKNTEDHLRLVNDRLEKTREELETRVQERTQALKEANTRLAELNRELQNELLERQRAEVALRESETRFRTIFEESDIGIKLLDLDGRILAINPAFVEMLGHREDQLTRMSYLELTDTADIPISQRLFEQLAAGKIDRFRLQKRYHSRGGNLLWVNQTVSLVRDEQREPLFAIAMVENVTENKQMEAELSEVQRRLMDSREEERLHLSQELHDGALQSLYGLAFQMKSLHDETLKAWNSFASQENWPDSSSDVAEPEEKFRAQVRGMHDILEHTIQELRAICSDLRPPTLAPFGLEKAIRSHAESFQEKHAGIDILLDLDPDGQTLPERIRLALYRIYQHALSNSTRHGLAKNIVVRFKMEETQVRLEVEDDGCGFDVPERWIDFVRQGHLGLAGASERAQAIGGTMRVISKPGQGTRLQVYVPRAILEHALG